MSAKTAGYSATPHLLGPGALWHKPGFKLPNYIENVAAGLAKAGHDRSSAIAIAISTIRRWAAGGGNVTPEVRAASTKAMAEWAALKSRAHATAHPRGHNVLVLSWDLGPDRLELARHVRSEAGVHRYHKPIGSLIGGKAGDPVTHLTLHHAGKRATLRRNADGSVERKVGGQWRPATKDEATVLGAAEKRHAAEVGKPAKRGADFVREAKPSTAKPRTFKPAAEKPYQPTGDMSAVWKLSDTQLAAELADAVRRRDGSRHNKAGLRYTDAKTQASVFAGEQRRRDAARKSPAALEKPRPTVSAKVAPPGDVGIAKAAALTPRSMTDAQLEHAMTDALSREDLAQFEKLAKETDRRDAHNATERIKGEEQARRFDAAIARGDSEESAIADVYGIPIPKQRRDKAVAQLRANGYAGSTFDGLARQAYDDHIDTLLAKAEKDTNGFLFNERGNRVADKILAREGLNGSVERKLFTGTDAFARANASPELKQWWDANGGRPTFEAFKAELLDGNGIAKSRGRRSLYAAHIRRQAMLKPLALAAVPMVSSQDGPQVTVNGMLSTPAHIKAAVAAEPRVPPHLKAGYRKRVMKAAKGMDAMQHIPAAWTDKADC